MSRFPFDVQTCMLQFTTNSMDWWRVNPQGAMFTKYGSYGGATGNAEISIQNYSTFMMSMDAKNNDHFDVVSFVFVLKRSPEFYIYVITIPCFLLTFLSIVGCFWTKNLKDEQLAKLSIALTSMMSMTTFVDIVSQQIPKASKFPLLGTYVLVSVFIISLACVVVVILPEKRENDKEKEKSRMFKLTIVLLVTVCCLISSIVGAPADNGQLKAKRTTTTQSPLGRDCATDSDCPAGYDCERKCGYVWGTVCKNECSFARQPPATTITPTTTTTEAPSVSGTCETNADCPAGSECRQVCKVWGAWCYNECQTVHQTSSAKKN